MQQLYMTSNNIFILWREDSEYFAGRYSVY